MAVKIVCSNCGSEEIRKDAYAEWDTEAQDWILHSVYDDTVCDNCGQHDTAEEVPIPE